MPGFVVHAMAAQQVIRDWGGAGRTPFDISNAANCQAFLAGGMGPDVGYFPGGLTIFSDVAHYVTSADLARNLLANVQSEQQRAFAWGWCLHVVVDALLHPFINRAVAAWKRGDRDPPMTYAEDPVAHLQIEFGLDAYLSTKNPLVNYGFPVVFDLKGVEFICQSYAATYGMRLDQTQVTKSLRGCSIASRKIGLLYHMTATKFGDLPLSANIAIPYWTLYCPLRIMTSGIGRHSTAYGLTHGVRPEQWLLDSITEQLPLVVDRYHAEMESGFVGFPNFNLDTGLDQALPYSLASETLKRIGWSSSILVSKG